MLGIQGRLLGYRQSYLGPSAPSNHKISPPVFWEHHRKWPRTEGLQLPTWTGTRLVKRKAKRSRMKTKHSRMKMKASFCGPLVNKKYRKGEKMGPWVISTDPKGRTIGWLVLYIRYWCANHKKFGEGVEEEPSSFQLFLKHHEWKRSGGVFGRTRNGPIHCWTKRHGEVAYKSCCKSSCLWHLDELFRKTQALRKSKGRFNNPELRVHKRLGFKEDPIYFQPMENLNSALKSSNWF